MDLPSLPVRPEARVLTVSDILEQAAGGQLRVPSFQTGLRWGARQVEELFDSIVRGFPVGGLLLWRREGPQEERTFGPVRVSAGARPDALYLVDGQQRVTALVAALSHPDPRPLGGPYALWVDLVSGRFAVRRDLPGETWIPVNTLGDRRRLQHWARTWHVGDRTEALIDRAFAIEESIVRYTLTAYVVREASEEALKLIFSRTNSSGVPLQEEQVFQALFGNDRTAAPLDRLAAELHDQTSFGRLSPQWLLRCVKAVGGLDPALRFSERDPPEAGLVETTGEALRLAIGFLQRDAGFLTSTFLPYRFPLIVLAQFFRLFPDPHPRSRALLTRWVWRGALRVDAPGSLAAHGDSSYTAVRTHLADLGEDEHDSVQRLLRRVPRPPIDLPMPSALEPWNGGAATTVLHAASQLHDSPLRPDTEEPWDPQDLTAFLSTRDPAEVFRRVLPSENRAIALRVLLPRGYPVARLQEARDDVLAGLAITGEAATALRAGDADGFVAARAPLLEQRMRRLFLLKAAPADSDRPPISVLSAAK